MWYIVVNELDSGGGWKKASRKPPLRTWGRKNNLRPEKQKVSHVYTETRAFEAEADKRKAAKSGQSLARSGWSLNTEYSKVRRESCRVRPEEKEGRARARSFYFIVSIMISCLWRALFREVT